VRIEQWRQRRDLDGVPRRIEVGRDNLVVCGVKEQLGALAAPARKTAAGMGDLPVSPAISPRDVDLPAS
jgi:hypothetical protein